MPLVLERDRADDGVILQQIEDCTAVINNGGPGVREDFPVYRLDAKVLVQPFAVEALKRIAVVRRIVNNLGPNFVRPASL